MAGLTSLTFGWSIDPAFAQGSWALQNRGYYEPLMADVRAANVNVLFWGQSDEFPFVEKPGKRRVWDISLGKEIPIWGYETGESKSKPLAAGKWGFGIWAPVSFHMIEDFKDDSNPILNTDYRFSGMVKFSKALTSASWLAARLQFGHESTHVGDEFSVRATKERPDFERINVSYEYWEYGVSMEWFTNKNQKHLVTLRHSGIGLFDNAKGYYSNHLLGEDVPTLTASMANFEPSFGFEWKFEQPILGPFGPFVSLEARYRLVYQYHRDPSTPDSKQFSINTLVGVRRVERGFLEKGLPDLYFRFYRGVNPAGQFRSQKNYMLLGVGVLIAV